MGLDKPALGKQNHREAALATAAILTRELFNPPGRLEIRPDFPKTINPYDEQKVLEVINQELLKRGTSLEEVGRITLAYPHKHPELFPGRQKNNSEENVHIFQKRMKQAAPCTEWIIADGICETRHLGRSENQTSVHALMNHQIYEIHKPSQKSPLPFIDPSNKKEEFFIIVDDRTEQGTTAANFISYIEHNGGSVLAASTEFDRGDPIAQSCGFRKGVKLSDKFNGPCRNNKRLPQLAKAFADSAKKSGESWQPEQCLEMFENSLNRVGNSVFGLTDGECRRLIETVSEEWRPLHRPFPKLLKEMNRVNNI